MLLKRRVYIAMRKFLLIIIVFFSTNVHAEKSIEVWECKERHGYWQNILVKATALKDRKRGKIHVADVTHNSAFEIRGFNRRWDFGLSDKGVYKFAFVIKPNGDASYYDFSLESQSKPSIFMSCRQTK